MRAAGGLLCLFALALLVGGGALYTFVLTPAVFAAYPRNAAGQIVGTMMPHYFGVQLAAVAAATLGLVVAGRDWPGPRRALPLALLLGALVAQGSVQWGVYPRALEAKGRVATFEAQPDSPERKRFGMLHGVSMLLNLLVIGDGALVLVLVSRPLLMRTRREPGPAVR